MATIIQMKTPRMNLLVIPRNSPIPAPMPDLTESCNFLPPANSRPQAPKPAPMQAPNSVPRTGMGRMNVPIIAPVMAPAIAPIEPRQLAPALFAPPAPARNSISSPRTARIVMASSVYMLKMPSSHRHQANRHVDITMSQLPGSPKKTSTSHAALSRISAMDQT